MRKRSALKRQAVKKRKTRRRVAVWTATKAVSSGLVKMFCLFILLALVSLSFMLGYQYLLTSPHLKLEEIRVRGVSAELKKELIKMGDLEPGQGLLALNLKVLKQRMESHPWIRTVRLERRFPHTLLIDAEEQVPLAIVVLDRLYYMNLRGEIFKEVHDSESADFPLITGISPKDGNVREKIVGASVVLKSLSREEGLWSIRDLSELHLEGRLNLSLYFNDFMAEIKLKQSEIPDRIDELNRIVRDLSRSGRIQHVTAIDLNYPDGAVVSFKQG